jgi:hypothetical protein
MQYRRLRGDRAGDDDAPVLRGALHRIGAFKWRLLIEEGLKAAHTFSHPDSIICDRS